MLQMKRGKHPMPDTFTMPDYLNTVVQWNLNTSIQETSEYQRVWSSVFKWFEKLGKQIVQDIYTLADPHRKPNKFLGPV